MGCFTNIYMCLPYTSKGIFSSTSEMFFYLMLKLLRFSCFGEYWFESNQRSQFERTIDFLNFFLQLTFFLAI